MRNLAVPIYESAFQSMTLYGIEMWEWYEMKKKMIEDTDYWGIIRENLFNRHWHSWLKDVRDMSVEKITAFTPVRLRAIHPSYHFYCTPLENIVYYCEREKWDKKMCRCKGRVITNNWTTTASLEIILHTWELMPILCPSISVPCTHMTTKMKFARTQLHNRRLLINLLQTACAFKTRKVASSKPKGLPFVDRVKLKVVDWELLLLCWCFSRMVLWRGTKYIFTTIWTKMVYTRGQQYLVLVLRYWPWARYWYWVYWPWHPGSIGFGIGDCL